MTIGLLAIMQDEIAYVDRWAKTLRRAHFDHVVVVDGGSSDGTIARLQTIEGIEIHHRPFAGRFDDQRNFGLEHCQTDWVFELDADEHASAPFLAGLPAIIRDAESAQIDCVGVARLNFLDGHLVQGPGHQNLDYQYRLHNRRCHWRGNVHEEITGYRARCELTVLDGHFLVHDKSTARHEARNAFYRSLI